MRRRELMKELGYGRAYRYAHDEPEAYAAGETYLPEGMPEPRLVPAGAARARSADRRQAGAPARTGCDRRVAGPGRPWPGGMIADGSVSDLPGLAGSVGSWGRKCLGNRHPRQRQVRPAWRGQRCRRRFVRQQPALAVEPAGITPKIAVAGDHAVAGNDDRNRIGGIGRADVDRRAGIVESEVTGELAVARRAPDRNPSQRRPDAALELVTGRRRDDRVEHSEVAVKPGLQRPGDGCRRFAVDDLGIGEPAPQAAAQMGTAVGEIERAARSMASVTSSNWPSGESIRLRVRVLIMIVSVVVTAPFFRSATVRCPCRPHTPTLAWNS